MIKSIFLKIKNNAFNIGVYFLAALIPMGIKLLINPLIALNMEPVDYAIVGYYNSFNTLIFPVITFYAFNFYTKRYFELDSKERIKLKATIFQSLIYFSFLISLISLAGIYVYMHFFNEQSTTPFLPYALLSVFTLPLTGIFTLKLTDFKMEKKSKSFFNLSVSKAVIMAALALLLVVVFKLGALGRMSATFTATFLVFAYVLYKDFDLIKKKIDWNVFKNMLRFVWPLIIGASLNFFTKGYDKVYLERFGNPSELGYYVVAAQIVSYIAVFRQAISSTFQPDIYKAIVNNNFRNASKYIAVMLISVSVVVVVFIVLAPFIIDILTAGKYTYSAKYARILALSQVTTTFMYVVNEIIIVKGYTRVTLINKIVGVGLTIWMYSVLISKWEFMGAAWGQVASYLIFMTFNTLFLVYWFKKLRHKKNVDSDV